MKIKEKIRKYYAGMGIEADDEYIKGILEDRQRTNNIIRLYKQEEIKSMNYIFGKPESNKIFTEFELEAANKIDLFDRTVIKWCKLIWDNMNNTDNLLEIQNAVNERRCPKCI